MSELRKCPFCGGEARTYTASRLDKSGGKRVYVDTWLVHCNGCKLNYPADFNAPCATEAEAVAAWNRRAGGWVKCSERLPEAFKDVLIFDTDRVVRVAFYSPSSSGFDAYDTGVVYNATYWMPLPEPPEDECD